MSTAWVRSAAGAGQHRPPSRPARFGSCSCENRARVDAPAPPCAPTKIHAGRAVGSIGPALVGSRRSGGGGSNRSGAGLGSVGHPTLLGLAAQRRPTIPSPSHTDALAGADLVAGDLP